MRAGALVVAGGLWPGCAMRPASRASVQRRGLWLGMRWSGGCCWPLAVVVVVAYRCGRHHGLIAHAISITHFRTVLGLPWACDSHRRSLSMLVLLLRSR